MNRLKLIVHWFAHLFGQYFGHVVTWQEGDLIMVGFECDYCRKIDPKSIHDVNIKLLLPTYR